MSVIDNAEAGRFELTEDGNTAIAQYRHRGSTFIITHVEAPEAMHGTGAASRLMDGIVALVRKTGDKIKPACPYANAWFGKHPEHADLIAAS